LLAQLLGKANFAVSTEAGFGKDSGVDTLGHLIGNCATIENPSVPKLEFLAKTIKILAFNEVVTTTAMKVDEINQFLLAVAAHKPTLTKRSRRSDDVSEYIDISKLSILLLYNDIDHYKFGTPFFDEVAPAAVLDRFPRLRLTGRFTHVFENLATKDITEVVKANYDMLHNVVRSLYWYKQSYVSEYHGYDTTKLIDMPYRWQINTQVLFTIIDVLCDTQAEFDEYIHTFNGAVVDYTEQLQFPHKAKTFLTSLGLSEKQLESFKSFRAVEAYFRAHKRIADADLVAQINQAKLFRDKYALMESHGKHTTTENGLESFI
jgi:hypothetical protein